MISSSIFYAHLSHLLWHLTLPLTTRNANTTCGSFQKSLGCLASDFTTLDDANFLWSSRPSCQVYQCLRKLRHQDNINALLTISTSPTLGYFTPIAPNTLMIKVNLARTKYEAWNKAMSSSSVTFASRTWLCCF